MEQRMGKPKLKKQVPWEPLHFVTDNGYAIPYGCALLDGRMQSAVRGTSLALKRMILKGGK
jgi:hypothetical protein